MADFNQEILDVLRRLNDNITIMNSNMNTGGNNSNGSNNITYRNYRSRFDTDYTNEIKRQQIELERAKENFNINYKNIYSGKINDLTGQYRENLNELKALKEYADMATQSLNSAIDKLKNVKKDLTSIHTDEDGISHRALFTKEQLKKLEKLIKEGKSYDEVLESWGKNTEEHKKGAEDLASALDKEQKAELNNIEQLSRSAAKGQQTFFQGLGQIQQGFQKIYSIGKDFLGVWGKIDQSASKFAKSIGIGAQGMATMRKNAITAVAKGSLASKYNVSADELIGINQSYVGETGRNILLSKEDQTNMAAMHAVMGENGAKFAGALENFGLSYTEAADRAGKMFKTASKYGIDFQKYTDNVQRGLQLAQTYTFKNGIKGMSEMAKKATAIKLNMEQIASFAEKVSTIEGAVETGARLQTLGGPFTQFSNPLSMLNESLTDVGGLIDRFQNMVGGLGRFNSNTGEVEVSQFNKMRLKAAAEAMGMNYNEVMESVHQQGRQRFIGSQIANKGYSTEESDFLKNVATVKDGKAMVSYVGRDGEKHEVDLSKGKLSGEELLAIKQQTQSEADDIKDIAQMLRGYGDVKEGLRKQYDNNKAMATETLGIGDAVKNIMIKIGDANSVLWGILGVVTAMGVGQAVGNIFGGSKNLLNGSKFFKGSKGGNIKFGGLGGRSKPFKGFSHGGGQAIRYKGKDYFVDKSGKVFTSKGKETVSKGVLNSVKKGNVKSLGKIGMNSAKLAKGATPLAIAGVLGELGTDALINSGKAKKGGFMDYFGHIGSGMASGAGTGALIGSAIPGIGNAVGAVAGAVIGGVRGLMTASKNRIEQRIEDNFGIKAKGSYGAIRMKKIEKALNTGEISDRLAEKLKKNGDTELLEKIKNVRESKMNAQNMTATVSNATFNVNGSNIAQAANGGLLNGPSHKNGGMPILGSNVEVEGGEFVVNKRSTAKHLGLLNKINSMGDGGIIKPKKMENGGVAVLAPNPTANTISKTGPSEIKVAPIEVNFNGTIKLEGANGSSVDITKDITPEILKKITRMVEQQIVINNKGGNVINKPFYSI